MISGRITFKLVVLLLLIVSCNEHSKSQFIVFENIRLGDKEETYEKQFDSLKIPKRSFRNFNNNTLRSYYSNIFDYPEWKNSFSLDHVALIYPRALEATRNISELLVLICHTSHKWKAISRDNFEAVPDIKVIQQDVNVDLTKRIKEMLTSKYGNPKSESIVQKPFYYSISDDNTIMKRQSGAPSTETIWETKYYTVIFSSGVNACRMYDTYHGYSLDVDWWLDSSYGIPDNCLPKNNQIQALSFSFILYKLNDKAIEVLHLDNKRL